MGLRLNLSLLLCLILCLESGSTSLIRIKGNKTIVALLQVHTAAAAEQCSNELNFKSAVESQAVEYAFQKLQKDQNFENISLGFDIEDFCNNKPEDLLSLVTTLFKRHKQNTLTGFLVNLSDLLNQLVVHKSRNVPVFSLGSRASLKDVFYLEPKPRVGKAVASLIQKLNWTVFDVFASNINDYEFFAEAIKASKLCINRVFYEPFISAQTDNIGNETYPLLVFSDSLKTLKNLPDKLTRRSLVIASEFLQIDEHYFKTIAVKQSDNVESLNDFQEYLLMSAKRSDSWFGRLLRQSAQSQGCGGPGNQSCWSEILDELVDKVRHGERVIDAVYTIAHALKNNANRPLTGNDIVLMPEFKSPTNKQICFTQNKELSNTEYSVYNLAKTEGAFLGSIQTYSDKTVSDLSLNESTHDTSGCLAACPAGFSPVPVTGKLSKCCVTCENENSTTCEKGLRLSKDGLKCVKVEVDYLKWKHPLSIIIFILVILLFCVLLYLVNVYHKKSHLPIIMMSRLATMPLLLSLFVTLIHPLLPIIKPSATSCNAQIFGFIQALGIPLCILISRSNSYFKKFRNEDGRLKEKVCRSDPQNLIAIFLIMFQVTLSIIFISVSSAQVVYQTTADPYVAYIECSTFSNGKFLFPFFYTIVLSLFFTVKNFGAVTHEADIFESHFTALFFFGYYFLSFLNIIIVYAVIGKAKIMLLCVLAVLHLLNFLGFLFLPKVYVILFQWDPKRFSPPNTSDQEILILDLSEQTVEKKEAESH